MKLLQNILSTIDFSESSKKVVDKSILLAKNFKSNITLIHVIPDKTISNGVKSFVVDTAQKKLDEIAAKIQKKGIHVAEILIKVGVPFEEILNESHRLDYNVIVAGVGDKGEDDKYQLGTTVLKLMRKSQVPVWVVKNKSVKGFKKILCPVDFSDASRRAFANAITLAKQFDAKLHVINVFTPLVVNSMWYDADNQQEHDDMQESHEKEFAEFLNSFDLSSIRYKFHLLEGEPDREILNYIEDHKVDLMLIGTAGKNALSRLLMGSVAEKVTREVPCGFITTKSIDITRSYFESNLTSIEAVIKSAKELYENKQYELALERYNMGLMQHPDNIPIIKGLIDTSEALGDQEKIEHYSNYAKEVIQRTWGEEYLEKFGL